MYLVFDSETTGLPKDWNAPMKDLENWPRVIQLAWASYDEDGTLQDQRVDLIKPDNWEIPTKQFWIENGFNQATQRKTESLSLMP